MSTDEQPGAHELWKRAGGGTRHYDRAEYLRLAHEYGLLIPLKPGEVVEPLPCGWPSSPVAVPASPKSYGYVIVETIHSFNREVRTRVYDIQVDEDLADVRERADRMQQNAIDGGRQRDTYQVCELVEVDHV